MTYKYSDCCDVLLINTEICPKCTQHCTPMIECPQCTNLSRHEKDKLWECMICSGKGKVSEETSSQFKQAMGSTQKHDFKREYAGEFVNGD